MRFDIITIFPNIFDSYFNESILARAQKNKLISINTHDIRDYTKDKHKKVDDKPYGGGAGMVLGALSVISAVDFAKKKSRSKRKKVIIFSAKGKQFNQKMAYDWSRKLDQIILVAGRYEGIDERVKIALKAEEISVGPYVLTDGEIPAMLVVSAVTRLIPGVIRLESLEEESYWEGILKKEIGTGKLEYPHYTRPEEFIYKGRKYKVPKVLLSGDHKKIKEWREKNRK